ncbi:MAG TPA: sugar phosphate isomerase/epimerase [Bauldia sp.]|nr:sugar phosphate isomerase/epimerase [Bauldia sp.]
MPRLSLPHLTMLDATPPEVVRAAASAKFDGVGIRIFPTMPGEAQHALIGDTAMRREVLSLLADTGLAVVDIEAIWLRPDLQPRHCEAGFEAAGRLGARIVQVIGDDDDERRLTDNYAALCTLAAPYGLTLDLEYMAFARPNRLDATRRIVGNADVRNGGLMVDCLHVYRCGADPGDYLEIDSGLIHELQLCDAAGASPVGRDALIQEARFARRPPGEGALDLEAVWRVVPSDVWVSLEAPFGDERGKLPFGERARLLKAAADAFVERVGEPGGARPSGA